jgi:hypothetical protein
MFQSLFIMMLLANITTVFSVDFLLAFSQTELVATTFSLSFAI